jgi:hypothetical protein
VTVPASVLLTLSLGSLVFAGSPEPVAAPGTGSPAVPDPEASPAPLEQDPGIAEPSAEPPPPTEPPAGGFGTVTTVTTDSDVVVTPAAKPGDPDGDEPMDLEARREISLRAEIGYGQVDLGNAEPLDHQGMFLRAHLAFYAWVSKSRMVGLGFGIGYTYQGMNRRELPADTSLKTSEGQQQEILFSFPMLFRAHRDWFSIQPSALIGFAFYTGKDLWALDRRATIPRARYSFAVGGDLALCTAWDIVCVVGGSEYLAGIPTYSTDLLVPDNRLMTPWGWHVGVGVDILRILDRGNRVD